LTARDIRAAVGIGITVLLGISTVLGGLFIKGIGVALGVVGVACMVVVCGLLYMWWRHRPHPDLGPAGFAYPMPSWFSQRHEDVDAITELAKAAFVLLGIDKTPTGLWGWTYVYRRVIGPKATGLTAAFGSLGGASLVTNAVHSVVGTGNGEVNDWLRHPRNETLAFMIRDSGMYIRRLGDHGPDPDIDFEEPQHAGSANLMALWDHSGGPVDERHLRTIRALCEHKRVTQPYYRAMVARDLLQASTTHSVPPQDRKGAKKACLELLDLLIAHAESAPQAARVWAAEHGVTLSLSNQWSATWAVLPFLVEGATDGRRRHRLAAIIERMLIAQAACFSDADALLPRGIDESGKGFGFSVYGTSMAVTAWRTLHEHGFASRRMAALGAGEDHRALHRLVANRLAVIERPSTQPDGQELSVEGYFAWAGVLLAAASLGVRLSADEARKCLRLADELIRSVNAESLEDELQETMTRHALNAGLFAADAASAVGRAAARVTLIANRVRAATAGPGNSASSAPELHAFRSASGDLGPKGRV